MSTRYIFTLALFVSFTIDLQARDMSSRRVQLDERGGSIEVRAIRSGDTQTRDAVRRQLRNDRNGIKSATPAIQQHKKGIKIRYENTRQGGRIRITAKNDIARQAV